MNEGLGQRLSPLLGGSDRLSRVFTLCRQVSLIMKERKLQNRPVCLREGVSDEYLRASRRALQGYIAAREHGHVWEAWVHQQIWRDREMTMRTVTWIKRALVGDCLVSLGLRRETRLETLFVAHSTELARQQQPQ